MRHINLVEKKNDRKDEEVHIRAMCGAEDDRALAVNLELADLLKLYLIDDNLFVNSLEQLHVSVAHHLECIRLVVSHNDSERISCFRLHLLVNLVLINIQLERVFVIAELACDDFTDGFLH